MEKKKFEKICDLVRHGEDKQIEHQITHSHGKVIDCHGTEFDVEIDGKHQKWARQNCEESS